jgi:membrane-associated phospholipid phosphatase
MLEPRPAPMLAVSLIMGGAFAALGALVASGHLSGIDSYAARHLMPFGTGIEHGGSHLLVRLFAYQGHQFHLGRVLRLPASALLATVLILAVCLVLWRRGRRDLALLWLAVFVICNLVEGVGKLTITKPTIYVVSHGSLTAAGFPHSFPSGHAARAAVLAAAAASAWPRLWPLFLAWLVVVVVTAELDAIHTPSDLAGGLLLAGALISAVIAVDGGWLQVRAWPDRLPSEHARDPARDSDR